jgi:hypothetical protein
MNGLRFLKHVKLETLRDIGRLWRRFHLEVGGDGRRMVAGQSSCLMFKLGWGFVGF